MKFYFLGKFDDNGISEYINNASSGVGFDETISEYISVINELLPEYRKMHHANPNWLVDNSFDIIETTEIKISFVDEGAGYRNAVGYYIYDTDNEPKTIAHIKECYFIFPNASKRGSGGDLKCGDTIKLGYSFDKEEGADINYAYPTSYIFPPGKSIGFILYPNGWTGNGVNKYITPFTSNSQHNPEKAQELKFHTVCVKIPGDNRLLISFEDINRESSSCDHDFNDVVMMVDLDLNSVGKGFINKSDFEANDEEPDQPLDYIIGYKKIFAKIDGANVQCVATLYIPKSSTIMKKKFFTARHKTNKAYIKNIIVVPPKAIYNIPSRPRLSFSNNHISKKLSQGNSWYDNSFVYNVKSYVEIDTIDENTNTGIFFFYTFQEAADYDFDPMRL